MRHTGFKLSLACFFVLFLSNLQAQKNITATGGNASGSGGTISYSVGQVVYKTNIGANGSVIEGVQQPYEISVMTATEEAKNITLEIVVYPNPATDFIKLIIENYEIANLSFQLYSFNGILLINKKIESRETLIPIQNLTPANYFLNVSDGNRLIKVFKIIKTK